MGERVACSKMAAMCGHSTPLAGNADEIYGRSYQLVAGWTAYLTMPMSLQVSRSDRPRGRLRQGCTLLLGSGR